MLKKMAEVAEAVDRFSGYCRGNKLKRATEHKSPLITYHVTKDKH